MTSQTVAEAAQFKPVDPGAIERELQALWRGRAEARKREAPNGKPLGRTLLHSLVVFAPDPAAAAQAQQVIAAISPHQPGRMILLSSQTAGQAGLDFQAAVRLHCVAPESGQEPVCCEQVILSFSGTDAARRLPGAVLPLLVANVPSFLYWTKGNPFRHPILRDLEPAIDRLIVDSLTFAAPDLDLSDVTTAVQDAHFHTIISDLSWARLAAWRYQTAQIFDAANMRPYLKRVQHARLSYYAGTPVLAWLFGGWLAARLGWRCVERNPQGAQYSGGQKVEYEILTAGEAGQAGYFAGVKLTADDGATFEVARRGAGFSATHLRVADQTFERVVPLRDETQTEWLGHELGRLSATPTYNAALGQLAEAAQADAAYAA
jgi:glucose-6-phosphate dehydrogenase assembly protein OpcA